MKLAIFALAQFAFTFNLSFAVDSRLALEGLQQKVDFAGGCGCSVFDSQNQYLIFSDYRENSPAIVKINGQKRELKWISSTEKAKNPKKGENFIRFYSDGDFNLKINFRTTRICPKSNPACEDTQYSINTTLEHGKEKSKMKNLKGDCGC